MKVEKYTGNSPLLGTPDKKLGLVIKPGAITLKMLATEVLNYIASHGGGGGGTGVSLIDVAERMTEDNDSITDMEIKTSLFLYNAYNRVSAIARVVEPQSNIRYALFKVSYYDNVIEENRISYIAYTTDDDHTEAATWHYSKIIDDNDTLYPWAMTVFGDAVVDTEDNTLNIGNIKYTLSRKEEEPEIRYTYDVPVITSFTYPNNNVVSANGDTVYPTVKFSQTIVKTIDYGTRIETEDFTLTGTITHTSTSYNDKTLVDAEAIVTFTGNNPMQTGGIDNIGAITVGASDSASSRVIRTVKAVLNVNNQQSEKKEVEVRQSAASMDASETISGISSAGVSNTVVISKTAGVTVENVTSNATWITVNGWNFDDKTVTIGYTVSTNTDTTSRSGTVTVGTDIAGVQCVITFEQLAVASVITVDSTNIKFGTQYIGSSYTETVTVKGTNIKNNIVATVLGSDFSVSPTSMTPFEVNSINGCVLTITYAPTLAAASNGSITLSDGNGADSADDVIINLSGTGTTRPAETVTGYWGVVSGSTTLPSSISQASGTFEVISGAKVSITQSGNILWIAIPSSVNATVTGTGFFELPFNVKNSTTAISGYKLYYRYAPNFPADQATFTISM